MCKLIRVEGTKLYVDQLDAIDQTPVIDKTHFFAITQTRLLFASFTRLARSVIGQPFYGWLSAVHSC